MAPAPWSARTTLAAAFQAIGAGVAFERMKAFHPNSGADWTGILA